MMDPIRPGNAWPCPQRRRRGGPDTFHQADGEGGGRAGIAQATPRPLPVHAGCTDLTGRPT